MERNERPTVSTSNPSAASSAGFENRRRACRFTRAGIPTGSRAGNPVRATADTDGFTLSGLVITADYSTIFIVFEDGDTVHDAHAKLYSITRPVVGITTCLSSAIPVTGHTAQSNLRNGPYLRYQLLQSFSRESSQFRIASPLDRGSVAWAVRIPSVRTHFHCVSINCAFAGRWHSLSGLGVSPTTAFQFSIDDRAQIQPRFCHRPVPLSRRQHTCIGVGLGEFDVYFREPFSGLQLQI